MPIRKSVPSRDLARCTYLVWGSPKCGKTTFASRFPGAVFIATEDGMKGVEAARWESEDGRYVVQTWQEILDATKELLSVTPRPSMIVIDTLDNACLLIEQHFCKKYDVEFKNDGDLAFGKGNSLINGELRRYLLKLSSMGVGIILISHTAAVEKHGKKGQITVDQPSISEKVMPMILGMVDFTFYCTTDTYKKSADSEPVTRHVLYTRPAPTHIAGHRIGNLPEVLPLSYFEFVKAFNEGVAAGARPGNGRAAATEPPKPEPQAREAAPATEPATAPQSTISSATPAIPASRRQVAKKHATTEAPDGKESAPATTTEPTTAPTTTPTPPTTDVA